MVINPETARIEWADCVAQQAEQMLIIARATNHDGIREELLGYAQRLGARADRILRQAA